MTALFRIAVALAVVYLARHVLVQARSTEIHLPDSAHTDSSSFNIEDSNEKVLIRTGVPLRGRTIHHTAWSEEEKVPEPKQKEDGGKNSYDKWSLKKAFDYILSFMYDMEEAGNVNVRFTSKDPKERTILQPTETLVSEGRDHDEIGRSQKRVVTDRHNIASKNSSVYIDDKQTHSLNSFRIQNAERFESREKSLQGRTELFDYDHDAEESLDEDKEYDSEVDKNDSEDSSFRDKEQEHILTEKVQREDKVGREEEKMGREEEEKVEREEEKVEREEEKVEKEEQKGEIEEEEKVEREEQKGEIEEEEKVEKEEKVEREAEKVVKEEKVEREEEKVERVKEKVEKEEEEKVERKEKKVEREEEEKIERGEEEKVVREEKVEKEEEEKVEREEDKVGSYVEMKDTSAQGPAPVSKEKEIGDEQRFEICQKSTLQQHILKASAEQGEKLNETEKLIHNSEVKRKEVENEFEALSNFTNLKISRNEDERKMSENSSIDIESNKELTEINFRNQDESSNEKDKIQKDKGTILESNFSMLRLNAKQIGNYETDSVTQTNDDNKNKNNSLLIQFVHSKNTKVNDYNNFPDVETVTSTRKPLIDRSRHPRNFKEIDSEEIDIAKIFQSDEENETPKIPASVFNFTPTNFEYQGKKPTTGILTDKIDRLRITEYGHTTTEHVEVVEVPLYKITTEKSTEYTNAKRRTENKFKGFPQNHHTTTTTIPFATKLNVNTSTQAKTGQNGGGKHSKKSKFKALSDMYVDLDPDVNVGSYNYLLDSSEFIPVDQIGHNKMNGQKKNVSVKNQLGGTEPSVLKNNQTEHGEFGTILEYLYQKSNNTYLLSLRENNTSET